MNRNLKIMIKRYILLLILTSGINSYSQKNSRVVDSLLTVLESQTNDSLKINTLTRLFYNTVWSKPESSKAFALQKMELAKKNNFKLQLADANYNLGIYFNNIVESDSSKFYYRRSIDIFREIKNKNVRPPLIMP